MAKRKQKLSALAEPKLELKNLDRALEDLQDRHRDSCFHESEIRSEVFSEVRELLMKYGVLAVADPEEPDCSYCQTREARLIHKAWCVRRDA